MKQDTEKTRVIFRVFKEGDVLALFPDIAESGYHVMCYQHVGQHGAADYQHCVAITKPAEPDEYAALVTELESLGYNLMVRKRA